MTNSLDSGFISAPARSFYEAAGDPVNPALLFIHAGVADRTMWDAQMAHFSPRYRVVRYDTRGYGNTTMEDAEFANYADAKAVLDHLDIDTAVVTGCSRGGGIALDLALTDPQRVRGLVLVGSGPSGFDYQPPDTELARTIGGLFEQMETAWNARELEQLAALDVRLWGDGPSAPEGRMPAPYRDKMYQMCLSSYQRWTTDGQPIALEPPAAQRLAEITMPLLIVDGDLDLPSIATMAEAMQTAVPQAERTTLHGTAHLPPLEKPDEFNDVLGKWLEKLRISGR